MTRLLHVTTTDISLELLLGPQLRAFRDAGYEVHAASAPGPFVDGLVADGIVHHAMRHASRGVSLRDVAAMSELFSLFRRLRPTIVHTHNPKPGVYGRVLARMARVPVVVNTQHGLYAQATDRWLRRWFVYGVERMAAPFSDAELVQSPEDFETLVRLGVSYRKLRNLGNGVDLQRFHATSEGERVDARRSLGFRDDQVVVGAVGRLVWDKGYAELFAAARALLSQRQDLVFVVAGPLDDEKRDAVTRRDVSEAQSAGVRFLGLRRDLERLYAALDLYVLASRREGFPRSAMEAAACGLPIVTTDIRGGRQVVDDGRTGLLVPARDANALAAAIARLADDPAARSRMGQLAAMKAVAEFDQQRVIDATLDTYRSLGSAG